MEIKKASIGEKDAALLIAQNLKEWFSEVGLKNMRTDFAKKKVMVALENGAVCGFLCYAPKSSKMRILWMGVKRDEQRNGIGGLLLKRLEESCLKSSIHLIEVETLPEEVKYAPYEGTRAFYYSHGFMRVLYKKAKKKGWDDQIVLQKVLK